ncbi:MAG: chemotaxis protein CheW [Polaromonas sp.]|nr:chemotaxis protein CheW [Polaromonas sp.]
MSVNIGDVLLAPTAALLRGFDFSPEEAAPGSAQAHAASLRETSAQSRQGFRIGALNLMIGYTDASELAELAPLHRLPRAPHWFLGMSNLHGVLVPVFDLARWLGVERSASAKPMLLVLAHGLDAAGIVIDGLLERLRWSREQLADAALVPDGLAEIAPRAVLLGEQLWFDLEVSALLSQLETELRDASVTAL